MERENRRRFLTKAGAATGAAAFVGIPALGKPVLGGQAPHAPAAPAELVDAPGGLAAEPVVVFVRDAKRGEVTVLHGTRELTYRDRALVRRLLKAARVTSERASMEVS
jgi:hypothetical protein